MKNRKFTFLIPNSTWNGKRYWHNFPYVEGLLTGVLKNHGYDVDVIDANIDNLNPEQIVDQLRDLKMILNRASFTTGTAATVIFENDTLGTDSLLSNPISRSFNISLLFSFLR